MKRLCLLIMLLCLTLLSGTEISRADTGVQIKINGQLRNFIPGGQLQGGRTMLPIRYIVEDPAVNGQVFWDGAQRKVTIQCSNKRIVFTIGQKTALVNGVGKTLDVAPYIYQGRTYIPLRFFVEELGATVGWKSRAQTVVINFGDKPMVMGYYYYGTPDLLDSGGLSDAAFRWLETDGEGNLFYEYWNDEAGEVNRQQALEHARQNGIKTHASVMLMGWSAAGREKLHQLLSSEANCQRLIDNLRSHARQYNYDGINIDLEGIPLSDRDNFTRFLADLAAVLHQDGRTLSVAVPAKTAGSTWHQGYDYVGIGQAVDLVIVMAYDYSSSSPGASAPMDWVEDVTSYARQCIPADRLLLGIGCYGYDWNLDQGTKKTFTQVSLQNLWDSTLPKNWYYNFSTYTPMVDYIDANGQQHRVWYEDKVSLGEKYALALENQLRGIAFWQVKGAFTDFYAVISRV